MRVAEHRFEAFLDGLLRQIADIFKATVTRREKHLGRAQITGGYIDKLDGISGIK